MRICPPTPRARACFRALTRASATLADSPTAPHAAQKLMVDFSEYPTVLCRMLNSCISEPHTHLAVLVLGRDGRSHLDFIQNLEYKFVELLSAEFRMSDDDVVRASVTFRYNALKSRVALMGARLQDVNALIKLKSPGLLASMQRSPQRFTPTAATGSPYAAGRPGAAYSKGEYS
jgi:hypothetical protein